MTTKTEQICPACGTLNDCAIASGKSASACWCMGSPLKLPVPETGTACYCASCLRQLAAKKECFDAQQ